MEPALHDGEVVLVRKCESLLKLYDDDDQKERRNIRRYEYLQGLAAHVPRARIYEHPPTALPGHVVVYKNPETALNQQDLCVKRVVGLGGQWMRTPFRLRSLPPFTLYVQGDNLANSRDSRQLGPISKNLLVGIAEYVVWPPTSIRRVRRQMPTDEKSRAFWP